MHRICLALTLAAAALAGCSTPYSQITGERYFRAPHDTYPLKVVAVDGVYPSVEPVLVDPGLRQVTVRALPTSAQAIGARKTVPMEIKPCTLYYLVAVKETELAPDFTVRVDHELPVAGCSRAP
jgi:hypothetical protein